LLSRAGRLSFERSRRLSLGWSRRRSLERLLLRSVDLSRRPSLSRRLSRERSLLWSRDLSRFLSGSLDGPRDFLYGSGSGEASRLRVPALTAGNVMFVTWSRDGSPDGFSFFEASWRRLGGIEVSPGACVDPVLAALPPCASCCVKSLRALNGDSSLAILAVSCSAWWRRRTRQ
jgi:hypothetical protein